MLNRKTMVMILVWAGLLAGSALLFERLLNPNKAEALGNAESVELERDPSGHYRAEAFINGVKVPVMVDTGATGVAISSTLAEKLGLHSNTALRTTTANGVAIGYAVRLASVKLGGIEAKDVGATIAPGLGNEALLGMSFLGRMDIRLYQGKMTIKKGY